MEDLIRHANTASKLAEVSLVCALDICKAADYLHEEDDPPLRSVAHDIAHEVKVGDSAHLFMNYFTNLGVCRVHFGKILSKSRSGIPVTKSTLTCIHRRW